MRTLLTFIALAGIGIAEPVRSGHASVEWIAGTFEPGKPLQTGFRLIIDEGWHSYWINPGDAGSKFSVVFTLPEGWTASEASHPVPKRFLTGGLPGYGYEGEVIFPVTITPPGNASGPVELAAKVSWLTCNDDSCVPGKAEPKLSIGGEISVTKSAAEAISRSAELVPARAGDAKLIVRESGNVLSLSLTISESSKLDPAGCEVFPASLQAVDHSKPIQFEKTGPTWSASATKNEYAEGPLKELVLVLAKKGQPPVEVVWKAE